MKSQKAEYVQKVKENQKNQNQIFQTIAFTKSNKTTDAKIIKLEEFVKYLDSLS